MKPAKQYGAAFMAVKKAGSGIGGKYRRICTSTSTWQILGIGTNASISIGASLKHVAKTLYLFVAHI